MAENLDDLTSEEKAQALLDAEIQHAWIGLLSQEAGRLILWSILDKCGCFAFPHYGDSTDTLMRGRQQIGSELLQDHVFPHGMSFYTDMLLEAEAREQRLQMAAEQTEAENEDEK